MMSKQSNRFTVALDEDEVQLLERLKNFTNMSPAQTIQKLFPSHLEELWEYLTWLEQLPEGPSALRSMGKNLLHSYGPENLLQGIKRLDPTYQFESEKFEAGVKATIEQIKGEANDA